MMNLRTILFLPFFLEILTLPMRIFNSFVDSIKPMARFYSLPWYFTYLLPFSHDSTVLVLIKILDSDIEPIPLLARPKSCSNTSSPSSIP